MVKNGIVLISTIVNMKDTFNLMGETRLNIFLESVICVSISISPSRGQNSVKVAIIGLDGPLLRLWFSVWNLFNNFEYLWPMILIIVHHMMMKEPLLLHLFFWKALWVHALNILSHIESFVSSAMLSRKISRSPPPHFRKKTAETAAFAPA